MTYRQPKVYALVLVLLVGCSKQLPSGSHMLMQVTQVYSREDFKKLNEGSHYSCFLRLGGRDEEIADGRFAEARLVIRSRGDRNTLVFVPPGLTVGPGNIIEVETYAVREKNRVVAVRQKNLAEGPCNFIEVNFLGTAGASLYCEGIELDGWQKIPGSYNTWYKPPSEEGAGREAGLR